jgi:magnesium transporter
MKAFFEIRDGSLVESTQDQARVAVYAEPDAQEKKELTDSLKLARHDLESALDPDEISRVEFASDHAYIIWKRPNNVSFEQWLKFEVSSVGLFVQRDRLTFILGEKTMPLPAGGSQKMTSINSTVLQFLLYTVHHFFGHLKGMKQLTAELQTKLNISSENKYYIQMFALGESLIYYLNAIEANLAVLTKLRAYSDKIGFTKEEMDVMDDIIIEHQQCSRQIQIYSSVLSGLMDARGNIINNNMNVLLKNLMIINIVFLPLNLIASIGGMSEYSMMTQPLHWAISYGMFVLGMCALGWLTWLVLVKRVNREKITLGKGVPVKH